jgi:dihydrofolate reductase
MLSIIVATDLAGGIGYRGDLLFKIKEDLKRFKELTTGKTIIMGRKTFDSLPNGALPNRHNIVITTNTNRPNTISPTESLTFKNNIDELIEQYKDCDDEVFVIGGGFIYKQFLPYCNKIYLTRVYREFQVDTFFKYNGDKFELDYCSQMLNTDGYNYRFIDLVKKEGK